VVGPRIADVATRVRVGDMDVIPPDIEEQAFHSFDFVASAQLGRHLQLKAKVRNILKQSRELKQGDFSILRIDPGINGSLGLTVAY
jgi:hypothetical protein